MFAGLHTQSDSNLFVIRYPLFLIRVDFELLFAAEGKLLSFGHMKVLSVVVWVDPTFRLYSSFSRFVADGACLNGFSSVNIFFLYIFILLQRGHDHDDGESAVLLRKREHQK